MDHVATGADGARTDLDLHVLPVLKAHDMRDAASALMRALAATGLIAQAVVWQSGEQLLCEPADARLPDVAPRTLAALLQMPGVAAHILHGSAQGRPRNARCWGAGKSEEALLTKHV